MSAHARNDQAWWVSWYNPGRVFELHYPWWISGSGEHDGEDCDTICAAVIAADDAAVRMLVVNSYDEHFEPWFRFIEPRPSTWSPYSDRFPRAPWMRWPLNRQVSVKGVL